MRRRPTDPMPAHQATAKRLSWNVNGLRAALKRGFALAVQLLDAVLIAMPGPNHCPVGWVRNV